MNAAAAAPGRARWPWAAGRAVAWAIAAVILGRHAWVWCFGQFVEYDDQGYLMVAVQHLLDGRVPFDEIAVPYGPAWFLERWFLHGALGIPLTTDAVRWITVGAWSASALLLGSALARVVSARGPAGQALLAGLATAGLAALQLRVLALEPGHPQELYVLVVALAAFAAACRGGRVFVSAAVWGAFAGTLLLVKVNLGVLAIAALAVALDMAGVRRRWPRILLGSAVVLLPLPLMLARLDEAWVRELALGSVLGAAALLLVHLRTANEDPAPRRTRAGFAAGLGAALALGLAFALLRGASLGALLEELVVRPLGLPRAFDLPPAPLPLSAWVQGAGALAGAVCVLSRAPLAADLARWLVPWARVGFLGLVLASTAEPNVLFQYGAGWCWVLLVPLTPDRAADPGRWRAALVWVGLLERLQAYPVAGSQLSFGPLAWIPVAVWSALEVLELRPGSRVQRSARPLAVAFTLFVATLHVVRTERLRLARDQDEPLDVPGARAVHAPRLQAITARWLTDQLTSGPSTFVSVLGSNSLYGWTGKRPPTTLLVSHAWELLPAFDQEQLVRQLRAEPDPRVVDHPGLLGPVARADSPFFAWVRAELRPYARFGSYTLLCRRERAPPDLTGCAWLILPQWLPPVPRPVLDAVVGRKPFIEIDVGTRAVGSPIASIGVLDTATGRPVAWTGAPEPGACSQLFAADGTELLSAPPGRSWTPRAGERAWLCLPALPADARQGLWLVEGLDAAGGRVCTLPFVLADR